MPPNPMNEPADPDVVVDYTDDPEYLEAYLDTRKPSPKGVNIPFQSGSARAVKAGGAAATASFIAYILLSAGVFDAQAAILFIPVATGFFTGAEKFLRERKLWK